MDLVSRLKHYLDYRQISVTQFADECAIPRPTGSQLLAGRNKKVSDEIIGKIHAAYPDLNIVWLMFGEGDMVKDANIEISEPQNAPKAEPTAQQTPMEQTLDFEIDFNENSSEEMPEKITPEPTANTFTFATPSDPGMSADPAPKFPPMPKAPQASGADGAKQSDSESFTVTPGKGKRVTGIVVYYDDCTYESFIPDPNHSHPFIR